MPPSDHAAHVAPVLGCFRCAVGTLTSVPKDAMDTNISFRVPKALRDAAQEKAAERRENVSDVLRAALEEYVKRD